MDSLSRKRASHCELNPDLSRCMKLAILAAALLTTAPTPNVAQSPRWKEIGKTTVGNPVFIDERSVKKGADGIITATVRAEFVKPVETAKGPIRSSRTIVMFDCANKTTAVKENIYFHDEKKNTVYNRSAPGKPGFATTIKGSLPDVALAYVCKP